ncbi:unnamed protein product [Dibothriocephalus latus]|uniref:Uncharacterized protein n=1 Tax=Dibothriocephalus latus TaxID=60516 RepID=A0A3P6TJP7_DIBLA|nr:unnamed protein product [Dibothriocephalus latus]
MNVLSNGDRGRLTSLLLVSVGVCTLFGHIGSLPVILYFTTAFLVIFATVFGEVVFHSSQNFPLELLVNFFSNNAHWTVGVALSPNQGSISFFLASYTVFSVSLLFAACLGLGYSVLSTSLGKPVWELESVVLKPFAVPAFIAGRRGIFLLYCVVITTSVASCACNVLGLISLILHDFIQTYIKTTLNSYRSICSVLAAPLAGIISLSLYWCRLTREGVWVGLLGSPILGFIISAINGIATEGCSKMNVLNELSRLKLMTPEDDKFVNLSDPCIAHANGFPKVHETDAPLRMIVLLNASRTYNIAT